MKGFTFRLEKVWDHRKRLVDEHSIAVAREEKRLATMVRSMADLGRSIARQEEAIAGGDGTALGIRGLLDATAWLDHLRRHQEELDSEIQSATRELEGLRSTLTETWRDLEVLSRLREKEKADWDEKFNRLEKREVDEIGQMRAFRHDQARGSH